MYFESAAALLAMDGHGGYVWAAYGITAAVLLVLIISPLRQRRRIFSQLAAVQRREQAASTMTSAQSTPASKPTKER